MQDRAPNPRTDVLFINPIMRWENVWIGIIIIPLNPAKSAPLDGYQSLKYRHLWSIIITNDLSTPTRRLSRYIVIITTNKTTNGGLFGI